jgi:hypothetical protein
VHFEEIRTAESALLYFMDCQLATVEDLAGKKSRGKYDFDRQINIAQKMCDLIEHLRLDPENTRAEDIIGKQTVDNWAQSRPFFVRR